MQAKKKPDGVSSRPASGVGHVDALSRVGGAERKLLTVTDGAHDYTKGSKVDHALALARAGFRVFPLKPNEKKPYEGCGEVSGWVYNATTNPNTLRRWWTEYPDSNIGLLTTGRLVVDVDIKGEKRGDDALVMLSLQHGINVPPTRTHRTPTGGRHLWFDTDQAVENSVGDAEKPTLGPGLDVRGKNGYCVGPGSTIDGVPYTVTDSRPPVRAPDELVAKCKRARERPADAATEPPAIIDQEAAERRAIDYLQHDAPIAIEGAGGDDTTYRVACRVKDQGVSQSAALALMLAHWNERCEPPWDPDALAAKVRHAFRYGTDAPGSAAPEVDFGAVDVFLDVRQWGRDELVANVDALLALDDARLADVRGTAIMFGVAEDIDQILADARLRAASGIDVLGILAEPALAHSDATATRLAALKSSDTAMLERVRDRLTAGRKPPVGKRAFAAAVKRGEALAIRASAEQDAIARDKRVVHYDAAQLPECCDEIEAAVIADFGTDRERVLAYGGAYAAVRERAPTVVAQLSGEAYPAQPLIYRYDAPALRERVMRSVVLMPRGGGEPIRCPDDVVQTLVSRRGGSAPPLAGILEAPTLRPDGSLLEAPGYDATTGLYAWFDPAAFTGVPTAPTQDEAAAALAFLRDEFLDEFDFASPVDKDVAIAALLTALLRRTLPDVPGFVFSAPQQSSGKTALANAISGAAFGRPAAAVGWPRSDEEMTKMLLGLLQQGQTAICFDNARDGSALASTELARAMTSPTFGGRLLGVNDHAEFPTNVIWFITGNNVVTAQDMTTRFIPCALQPTAARPDQRTFRRDLAAWVAQNRARVVAAGLTILRTYRVAGAPAVGGKPSRFRTWDANVRFALVHAGGLDVGVKFDEADLADSALGALRRLLRLWPSAMGTLGVQAKDIEKKCVYASSEAENDFTEALRDLLVETKGKAVITAHSIAACLAQWKDRVVGGRRLVKMRDNHEEVTTWRVASVGIEE